LANLLIASFNRNSIQSLAQKRYNEKYFCLIEKINSINNISKTQPDKKMTDKIVVLVNCSTSDEAKNIGKYLVEKRLAACVNIIPMMQSWYWWEDKVTQNNEVLIIIKTSRKKFSKLEKEVVRLHSYAVPEVVALQIVEGSNNYLNWIDSSLQN